MAELSRPSRLIIGKQATGQLLRLVTHVGALIPLATLIWGFSQNDLGADPVRTITLRTGSATLYLLVLALAVTPVVFLTGWKQLVRVRRALGLYAFLYLSLHLLTFLWLDYAWMWAFIYKGIVDQWYVIFGLLAFFILLPMAATSTRWAMGKMGKNWKRLHRWFYVAIVLGLLHYFLLVKNVYTEPILFALVVAVLLLLRRPAVKRAVMEVRHSLRQWRRGARKPPARPAAVQPQDLRS